MPIQQPLFPPQSDWTPPDLNSLPDWRQFDRISLDTETRDPTLRTLGPAVRRGGKLVGISFAGTTDKGYYLPIGHEGGDNMNPEAVLGYIREQLAHFEGDIVGANLQYDMDYLMEAGCVPNKKAMWRDVQVAEPLLNELRFSYSLNNILKEWGFDLKDGDLMLEAAKAFGMKKDSELGAWICELPGRYVGPYAERDATAPLELIKVQEEEIRKQGLQTVYDLECAVQPTLIKMRRRGVAIDFANLAKVETYSSGARGRAAQVIDWHSNLGFGPEDFNKKELLVRILNEVGVKFSASDSLDADWIAGNSTRHPIIAAIGYGRKHDKMLGSFIKQVKEHQVNGRIHTTFNQLRRDRNDGRGLKGAAYGRLSSSDPNMQQQPSRDPEVGAMWRRNYIPDEGKTWACLDYSQQEPRLLAHYAELADVAGGEDVASKYREDPETDTHDVMTQMVFKIRKEDTDPKEWKFKRGQCKIIFLGLCYNMGEQKLCNQLGLPTVVNEGRNGKLYRNAGPEGKRLFNTFHANFPMVAKMQALCDKRARARGYITTLSGRRCRFPRAADGLNWDWTHKGLNRLIQGAAADQTKMALVALDKAGFDFQLQVHDEIDASVENREEAEAMAEIMKTCCELGVPSKVDVEMGPNWGDIK